MNDSEIIELLGGPAKVARIFGIKTPSVSGWYESGIPEGRLIEIAARVEKESGGRFSRRERFPDRFHLIWPELADVASSAESAGA